MGRRRPRYVNVVDHVHAARPDIDDPVAAIADRKLMVDGRIVTSVRALVPATASVVLRPSRALRGEDKLRAALNAFAVDVADRICLDIGAAAGGFTRVLLEHGAAKVIAVDVGFGQLRGSLRAHSRVVNLERTNVADLGRAVPRCWDIEVITLDVSYLSVSDAVPQMEAVRISPTADLVALVKPMFELGLAEPPTDDRTLIRAVELARRGIERHGRWCVVAAMPSPVTGARGAREWLLHARRGTPKPEIGRRRGRRTGDAR
jgi:23S rRNA (cytidine1920-2'-O)/16S rRNA (cytidine1409-2'-O)-methyltransferase